jgi:MFS family permease
MGHCEFHGTFLAATGEHAADHHYQNAYSITFGSFLLFWGRVADLNSAKPVFCYGFLSVGICNLIISFLPEKYSLFLFRSITGIAGAALVPTSYRLIAETFPKKQRHMAYTIFGMTGSIANVLGTVIAGVIDLIPNEGQMRSYRWFFRIMAAIR